MSHLHLNWIKCQGDVWCKLDSVNLQHSHFNHLQGVYMIWHGGPNPAVVYVGQGSINERLAQHRTDTRIQAYSSFSLYVTWADVAEVYRDGVEAYLADYWKPKVGSLHPTAEHITVNSPW